MTVNPFHKLKNAKSAMEAVADHPMTTCVQIEEELGHAMLSFRWSEEASIQALKGLTQTLESSGWEEKTDESAIGDHIIFEWDKKYLTED